MNNLSKQIENFIKNELSQINNKINGILLLELMKYKLITYFNEINLLNNIESQKVKNNIKDNYREINFEIIFNKLQKVDLKHNFKNDTLFICLQDTLNFNLEDFKTKKNINIRCIPMTSIVIPKGSNCSLSYSNKSIFFKITLNDETLNIEKLKENTI